LLSARNRALFLGFFLQIYIEGQIKPGHTWTLTDRYVTIQVTTPTRVRCQPTEREKEKKKKKKV
jgi:hypothetical protein